MFSKAVLDLLLKLKLTFETLQLKLTFTHCPNSLASLFHQVEMSLPALGEPTQSKLRGQFHNLFIAFPCWSLIYGIVTFVVSIAFNSEVTIERISNNDKIITVALASHVMTCNVPFLLWVPYVTLSYFIFSKIQGNLIPQENWGSERFRNLFTVSACDRTRTWICVLLCWRSSVLNIFSFISNDLGILLCFRC